MKTWKEGIRQIWMLSQKSSETLNVVFESCGDFLLGFTHVLATDGKQVAKEALNNDLRFNLLSTPPRYWLNILYISSKWSCVCVICHFAMQVHRWAEIFAFRWIAIDIYWSAINTWLMLNRWMLRCFALLVLSLVLQLWTFSAQTTKITIIWDTLHD